MPVSHQQLLRYLMVVLRRVGDNAANNEMTPYNVAACIGQCLLWPPSDVAMSSDRHLTAAKKLNQVVEKMINGAHEIFGSERLPLLLQSEFSSETSKLFFGRVFSARQHAERAICYRPSVRLSVCLSHGWISQKRLNVSSKFFHHLIGQTF